MKFSIIVPVLNSVDYLAEALHSIRLQDYENWQCMIVDGGSTDGSLQTASEFCKSDPRFSLIEQEEQGIYPAVLQGIAAADGEIVSWLNADDMYAPWALKTARQFLSRPNIDWIVGLATLWDKTGAMRLANAYTFKPGWMIRAGLFRGDLLGPIQAESVFFRHTVFDQLDERAINRVRAQKLAGDYFLWRAMAGVTKLHAVPVVLGGFRLHGENRSVDGEKQYQEEAIQFGPRQFPAKFGLVLRYFYNLICSLTAFWAIYAENKKLNLEIFSSMGKNPTKRERK
jgi:glycosyltransferase involved in cell wall biosynthesis